MELLASHPSCVPSCVASSFELVCWVCNSNLRCLNILAHVQVKLYCLVLALAASWNLSAPSENVDV